MFSIQSFYLSVAFFVWNQAGDTISHSSSTSSYASAIFEALHHGPGAAQEVCRNESVSPEYKKKGRDYREPFFLVVPVR